MKLHLPQLIWFLIAGLNIYFEVEKHGKMTIPVKSNIWIHLTGTLIGFGLLYWGGFF